ncbi:hypothetical protein KSP40_PGU008131 [Platanthera guangdongensis]|uniref:Uncharacterized protein n=1 Tax=Platanthera guangdongensis TaxID=2320717 RepID=A0ABR2MSC4_9ASPA
MPRILGRRREGGSHCGVVLVPLSGTEQRQDEDGQRIYGGDWMLRSLTIVVQRNLIRRFREL